MLEPERTPCTLLVPYYMMHFNSTVILNPTLLQLIIMFGNIFTISTALHLFLHFGISSGVILLLSKKYPLTFISVPAYWWQILIFPWEVFILPSHLKCILPMALLSCYLECEPSFDENRSHMLKTVGHKEQKKPVAPLILWGYWTLGQPTLTAYSTV